MSIPIVLFVGQSNTPGRGVVELTDDSLGFEDPYPLVEWKYQIAPSPADPPVWTTYGPGPMVPLAGGNEGIFGAWMRVSRALTRRGVRHAQAMMAIDSSYLNNNWRINVAYPTVGDNLFAQLLDFAHDAETDLDGHIAWLVWNQWEADADQEPSANVYETNLKNFINAIRSGYAGRDGFPGLPVTIIRGNPATVGMGLDFAATVIAAQDAVASELPGVRIVNTDDATYGSGVHYDELFLITLGDRQTEAMLADAGRPRIGGRLGSRIGARIGARIGHGRSVLADRFPPVAAFTTDAAGLTITFTDASLALLGSIASWRWDFGDGASSTEQNPSHEYATEGTYRVTLTVRDTAGRAAQVTSLVEVILWAIDAANGKPVPSDETQWDNFVSEHSLVVGSPEHLWLFQDVSGNLAAVYGGKTLTVTGTPLYQQTETGWARKFICASGAAQNQFAAASGMAATTSAVAVLMLARIVQPAGIHQRAFYGSASSNAFEGMAGAAMRYRTGASARSGSASQVGAVRWFWFVHDPSGTGRMGIYSALEKLTFDAGTSPAYAARSGTGIQFQFGVAADATALTSIGLAAAWSGASVEFADLAAMDDAASALLTALGDPPVW